jgi:type VII secretion-associated serine protease mycosin
MRFERNRGGSGRKILHPLYVALVAPVLALPGAAAASLVGAHPAAAAPVCTSAPAPQPDIEDLPWAQRWFQPDRVWPISRGTGVTVAVLDSGVDATHPQLARGNVLTGLDMVTNTAGGNVDCDSHGTAVASIVAARAASGIGFAGLAPGVTILPIRVAERGPGSDTAAEDPPVEPNLFATAVRRAADGGARVINASVVFFSDHAPVAEAIRYAQDRGALVVAAAGNHHDDARTGTDPVPYPAAYPGVVGVGAIGADGIRLSTSYVGPHVDLVAPGGAVTAAARGSGHANWTGTSFAAAFVSATAALLIARDPAAAPSDVARKMLATADPPAGDTEGYGHGVVNPYRALTERVTEGRPVAADPLAQVTEDPAAVARAQRWLQAGQLSIAVSLGVVGLALAIALTMVARNHGRRRRERPEQAAPPPPHAIEDAEREFFTVPRPRNVTNRAPPAQVTDRAPTAQVTDRAPTAR